MNLTRAKSKSGNPASPKGLSKVHNAEAFSISSYWRIRKKFWVNIVPDLLAQDGKKNLKGENIPLKSAKSKFKYGSEEGRQSRINYISKERLRLWLLVLEAKKIPFRLLRNKEQRAIFVPALVKGVALWEIWEFEAERAHVLGLDKKKHPWEAALLVAIALFFMHALRLGWFRGMDFPFLPQASEWPKAFGLDVYRTREWGQWWRALTALGIHGSLQHLFSNMLFGTIFIALLSRRASFGKAFFIILLGGFLGNSLNALYKPLHSLSVGFSTSSFAAVGALTAYACGDRIIRAGSKSLNLRERLRPILISLGAGFAMLAFLGGAGKEKVDFSAHVFGLLAGFTLGLVFWLIEEKTDAKPEYIKRRLSNFLFVLSLAMLFTACFYAFGSLKIMD